MSALQTPRPAVNAALELDVLRGIAAILMIVNHAGLRLLSPADASMSLSGAAVFLGSFAPVIFFFATGFGVGLATGARGRRPVWPSLLWKAGLLVVADQFFFWRQGIAAGLDFFSFIAIATIVVTLLASLRRSFAVCIGLIGLLLAMRYGVGPILRTRAPDMGLLAAWIFGVKSVIHVSYPLAPWMVYPLLGFALGKQYRGNAALPSGPRKDWLVPGATVMLGVFVVSLWLGWQGIEFFRWGTMNAAFFLLSFGILAACALSSVSAAIAHRRVASALALRGVASFAVIPLHYAMLDAGTAMLPLPIPAFPFVALVLVIIVASFWLANRFASAVAGPFASAHRGTLLATFLLSIAVIAVATPMTASRAAVALAMIVPVAQLAVAGILGLRATRPLPSP